MQRVDRALSPVVAGLSDKNYTESFTFYRFWFDIGQRYHQVPSDWTLDAIWNNRGVGSINPIGGKLFLPSVHLIIRFARDAESDHILAPYNSGLQGRLSARSLQDFFSNNLTVVWYKQTGSGGGAEGEFCADTNLIAHWANLGFVEEAAIRNDILQSLISHPKLYDHQADALLILFKLAGATFEAYADPPTVDRCLELLKSHSYNLPYPGYNSSHSYNVDSIRVKSELVQVRASRAGAEKSPG